MDRFNAAVRGNLDAWEKAEHRAHHQGIPRVMRSLGNENKEWRRGQLRASGLNGPFLKSIQAKHYRNSGPDAASLIVSPGKMFELYQKGGSIRSKKGGYLVITLKGAGKQRGPGGGRMRKQLPNLTITKNIKFLKTKRGLLVVRQTKSRSTPLFLLVKQTRHRKRANFAALDRKTLDKMPREILKVLPK